MAETGAKQSSEKEGGQSFQTMPWLLDGNINYEIL